MYKILLMIRVKACSTWRSSFTYESALVKTFIPEGKPHVLSESGIAVLQNRADKRDISESTTKDSKEGNMSQRIARN